MTRPLHDDLVALANRHPVPNDVKLERRMKRIDRMARFYEDKMPVAPEAQSEMFRGFVGALIYALTTIKMYRKLTKRLADLAKEAKDEV